MNKYIATLIKAANVHHHNESGLVTNETGICMSIGFTYGLTRTYYNDTKCS